MLICHDSLRAFANGCYGLCQECYDRRVEETNPGAGLFDSAYTASESALSGTLRDFTPGCTREIRL
jgi:hypothetical protein